MIRYKIVSSNTIYDRVREIFIPFDMNNIDYLRYLAWVAQGNVAEPVDLPRTPDADDDISIRDVMRKVRRLARRVKALLPDLDINDIV